MRLGIEGRVWTDDYKFVRESGHYFGSPYSNLLVCERCGKTKDDLLVAGIPNCDGKKPPQ